MNCTQANQINPLQVLKHHYHLDIERVKNNSAWFKARDEKTASLKVDLNKNIWYDFGTGKGGKTIDLVCYLSNVGISEAINILNEIRPCSIDLSSFEKQKDKAKFEIGHLEKLNNPALIQYLNERKIPFKVAREAERLKEAYWQYNGNTQFALAWENDDQGLELRNKFYKGGTSPKTITTIQGSGNVLNVFEGFFDYLSALVFYNTKQPSYRTIILNGVGNLSKISSDLSQYRRINAFLDNDKAGKTTLQQIKDINCNVDDRSVLYESFKDFNKYLCNQ